VRRGMSLLALGAVAIGGVAAGVFVSGGGAGTAASAPKTITVTASEFKFVLSRKSVPAGSTVRFAVVNKGKVPHDFKIKGKKTKTLNTGQKATLTVVFPKKGTIAFLCTLPGHAQAGMKGKFGVGVTPPPTPTPTPTPTPSGPETLQGDPVAGGAVFAREGCGSCHTLAAAGANGTIGPNLDQKKPSQATVRSLVQNGFTAGGIMMPSFNLNQADLNNIAAFVYASTH